MIIVPPARCPLCSQKALVSHTDEGVSITCNCISGSGKDENEASQSWNRSVSGFMDMVQEQYGPKKPKSNLILPN